ncbi:MAG: UDP-glucose 4-epimerase GalE [bacterium]|nr:UDP-glucose 4-epimerase GalE [bacterium]
MLVTGGAGYIGSHIVRDLGEKGFQPIVYDNLSTGYRENQLCGQFILGDVKDAALLKETISKYNIKSVIHFAAFIQVGESVTEPLKYYRNNSINTFNLIDVCIETGIQNFVFSSTASVYGLPETLPIPEALVMNPINPYGGSKVVTEMILRDVSHANPGFNYVALRYFNVAGADPKCRIGQNYKKPTHLITMALRAALGEYPELKVFGTDYDTPDGTCIRDYIHVDDLSNAHLLALDFLESEKRSRVFNCGYGDGRSVWEVVNAAKRVTGIDFNVVPSPRRPGDPPTLVANSQRIQRELGWQPQFNDIDYIIQTAWEWEKKLKQTL